MNNSDSVGTKGRGTLEESMESVEEASGDELKKRKAYPRRKNPQKGESVNKRKKRRLDLKPPPAAAGVTKKHLCRTRKQSQNQEDHPGNQKHLRVKDSTLKRIMK